ncbi:tRNA (5-methylaminomethyl-2-thiouridine)(34)-methyltransferase MnmD [Neolewinella antarctica]|uniref:tRNA U34 5-methylaminomethyl-2-thiouridine-forming methyltransferase MnmC n=1 Tax=Neolewinella antarctica TaxID=442734 RepID=A0ABX0XBC3_9BACT|nr:tRNA (5-methylaminomethyl-2-thiouridine)(34)-methyltransferase MnmD [Neolewinella antarctica]NJC26233.1 tRNA U34 5-methylaminomethyl-2-thiouridine-forming methyltransferase MnmC [Neolewinella antarctica]
MAENLNPENELFVTDDGSHSLLSHRFAVAYHSRHGAIQESRHVFIEMGLKARLAQTNADKINILELGFGTGLNAYLTLLYAEERPDLSFEYCSFEKYPIPLLDAQTLNYAEQLAKPPATFVSLHSLSDDGELHSHPSVPNFSLAKSRSDFLSGPPEGWQGGKFDLIYYDAFAPASQPELWTPKALKICYDVLATGGIFVTYCAKGQVKRDLRDIGFRVEPLPGPPGKREMTRGVKL